MGSFLVIIALVTLFFFGFVLLFMRMGKNPIYRANRESMLQLFDRVLSGEAADIEWRTFLSVPIRHDEYLEDIRQRCEMLEDEYSRQVRGYLLNREGRAKLAELREELETYAHKEF